MLHMKKVILSSELNMVVKSVSKSTMFLQISTEKFLFYWSFDVLVNY